MTDAARDREAFERFCKEKCSPNAESSEWYYEIWQAALAYRDCEPADIYERCAQFMEKECQPWWAERIRNLRKGKEPPR